MKEKTFKKKFNFRHLDIKDCSNCTHCIPDWDSMKCGSENAPNTLSVWYGNTCDLWLSDEVVR
jgi:hypothetical protein